MPIYLFECVYQLPSENEIMYEPLLGTLVFLAKTSILPQSYLTQITIRCKNRSPSLLKSLGWTMLTFTSYIGLKPQLMERLFDPTKALPLSKYGYKWKKTFGNW